MKYIKISGSDLKVSQIIYGVWRWLDDAEGFAYQRIEDKIHTCLDTGIHTFDHADLYGHYRIEELFGQVLQKQPSLRQKMVLISKCGIQLVTPVRPENQVKHYDTSKKYIQFSVENSLKNLKTDYLDILLIHRPDPLMRAEETASTLNNLIRQGKIRYAGVSNFSNTQFDLLNTYMEKPLISNQIELSLLHTTPMHDGTLDFLQKHTINPMAWSPLGGGKLFSSEDERGASIYQVLASMTDKYGALPEQIALAWLLRLPVGVLPILGTNNLQRIREADSATEILLDLQDWFNIYKASLGKNVP